MLQFKQLELTNFGSFVGTHILRLERGAGLHFVTGVNEDEPRLGSNGSGKSTIWSALCWCLFGRTVDGLRNTDIRPWNTEAGATRVDVTIGRDKVVRTTDPNTLSLGPQAIDQESLEKWLGLSFTTFKHSILLGQGQPLFIDLPPRDKLAVLSDALQLERWDERSDKAKLAAQDIHSKIDKLAGLTASLEDQQEENKRNIEHNSKAHDVWEKERFEDMLREISKLKDLEARFKLMDARRDQLNIEYDAAATEAKASKFQYDKLMLQEQAYVKQRSSIEADKRSIENLLKTKPGDKCPTCGQSLKGTYLEAVKLKLENKLRLVNVELEANKTPAMLVRSILRTANELKAFEAKAETARDALMDDEHARTKASIDSTKRWLADKDKEENPYQISLRTLRKLGIALKTELKQVLEDTVKLSHSYNNTEYWFKGFKQLKLLIVQDLVQELELCSNSLLEQLGMIGWSMKFDIDQGINVSIVSPKSPRITKLHLWSGGEALRLKIISAMALSDVLLNHAGVETNLMIFDEPSYFLSKEGVSDMIEMLAERAEALDRTIFYIDHVSYNSGSFKSVTTVVRDIEGSYIDG